MLSWPPGSRASRSGAWQLKLEGETGTSLPPGFADVTLDEDLDVEDEDVEAESAFEDVKLSDGLAAWGLALLTNILMVASLSPMSKTEGESG